MYDEPQAASPPVFTPSELVVLFGERFAEEGGMLTAKEEALVSRLKVSAEKMAHAAMAAALLANEKAGAVRLETRQSSAVFGLVKGEKVHAVAGDREAPWPEGTLEYQVAFLAYSGPTVTDLYSTILGDKSTNPSQRLAGLIKAGLAQRDLMDVAERRMLGLITVPQFILREDTRAAALRESPEPVLDLLKETERDRPKLWEALLKEIRAAITWSTDSD